MANFTAREQLMLELINRARMDPRGEAKRYGIDLNEGGPSPAISDAPKQVLAGSDALGKAADKHSKWMAWNGLSHTEGGNTAYFYGTNPDDRMERAGFASLGSWAENIGYRSGSTLDRTQAIYDLHQSFFVDSGVWGRGHRVNMLAADLTEIGIGSATKSADILGAQSHYVTVDFADASGGKRFITGVVYNDTVTNDDFFTVGEQLKSRTVTSGSKQDVTGGGGGYELAFTSSGSRTVTFDLAGNDLVVKVALGTSNVKVDAVNGSEIWTNATLESQSTAIKELHALGVGSVKLTGSSTSEKIYGNAGANALNGKGGNDTIIGFAGADTLDGGGGNDVFVFRKASHSPAAKPDIIKGFDDSGDDIINLKDVFVGTLLYRGTGAIADAGEVSIVQSGAHVRVNINIDTDLEPEMTIVLRNTSVSAMSADDFIL